MRFVLSLVFALMLSVQVCGQSVTVTGTATHNHAEGHDVVDMTFDSTVAKNYWLQVRIHEIWDPNTSSFKEIYMTMHNHTFVVGVPFSMTLIGGETGAKEHDPVVKYYPVHLQTYKIRVVDWTLPATDPGSVVGGKIIVADCVDD